MTTTGWTIIGIGVVIGIGKIVFGRRTGDVLAQRRDADSEWDALGCCSQTRDDLLEVVCEAFGFSPKIKRKFRPSDTVIGFYRAVYARRPWADAMEIETFLLQLDHELGVSGEDIGPDSSLAAIAALLDVRRRFL